MSETKSIVEACRSVVGDENVIVDPAEIPKALRDNSWLSPMLTQHIDQLRDEEGQTLDVDAVVAPRSVSELRRIISLAVRYEVPLTVRGGGTSNFGQAIPLEGGIIINTEHLNEILSVTDTGARVQAGAVLGDINEAARAQGKELPILTTTYASATAGGWVAGGHVGLGANAYGTIWDGNVRGVTLLTAEDPPREVTLTGDDLLPALHTYGTTGVITEVTFPLVKARAWLDAVAAFDSFDAAVRFTAAMTEEPAEAQNVVAAQEPAIAVGFTPLRGLFDDGQAIVLAIVDAAEEARFRELCTAHDGTFNVWCRPDESDKVSIAMMVYGHRMLWIKKLVPEAAFLHVYFSPDRYAVQLQQLKERFGDDVWLEFKFIKSRWLRNLRGLSGDAPLPAAVLTLVPGDRAFLETVMAYCDEIDVSYLNPHTFLLEESGLFPDFEPIAAFKRKADPKGILNPGKIGVQYLQRQEASS